MNENVMISNVDSNGTNEEASSCFLQSTGKVYDKNLPRRQDGLISTLLNFPLRGYDFYHNL